MQAMARVINPYKPLGGVTYLMNYYTRSPGRARMDPNTTRSLIDRAPERPTR